MNVVKVVVALIKKEDCFLIARRKTGDESVFGKWEFPGGKVEDNENEFSALEREIKEEFDVEVKASKFLINNLCEYPNKIVDLRLYECKYVSGTFKLHDHFEYKFVTKEDILNYDLCIADIPLAKYVKETM